jgi:hypothetical protein
VLVISDGPSYGFGTLATGTSTNHVLWVTNTGTATATAMTSTLAAPFAYTGGAYPGASATCGSTLVAGASCALNVAFTPSSPGTAMATLAIAYFDGVQTTAATRDLSGKGTSHAFLAVTDFPLMYYEQYALQADPSTFAFGMHGVGSTTTHAFYLTNMGASAATGLSGGTLPAPFSYAGGSFPGAGGTCSTTLAAGDDCSVVVAFNPVGTSSSTATLSLAYDDGTGAVTASRPLSGSGTSGPLLVVQDFDATNLTPSAWDFGTRGIGVPATHEFYVVNNGSATASAMSAPAIGVGFGYVGGNYPGTGGSCSTLLAPGASCIVNVVFQPVAIGLATGSVRINYQDTTGSPFSASRAVRGAGTNTGLLDIAEGTDHNEGLVTDFGAVGLGSAGDRVFTVRNVGGGGVSAMTFATPGTPFSFAGGSFPGTKGNCGATLAAGAACTVDVAFTPVAVGDFSTVLSLTYNDGSATQGASRAMIGQGIDGARLTISDWSGGGNNGDGAFDFGTWGVATIHTFYVSNMGNKTATTLAGVALAAPFSWTGGTFPGAGGTCNGTLAAGASCSVVVTFSGAATASGTIAISYADGAGNNLQATRQIFGALQQAASDPSCLTFT